MHCTGRQRIVSCSGSTEREEMSVRSRIKEFEELAKANEGSDGKRSEAKKRFHYPGNKRSSDSEDHPSIDSYTNINHIGGKIKTQRFDEFEADVQAAWSVRKNIHHQWASPQTSQSSLAPSVHSQAKAGQYSRHGAIPAQQATAPKSMFATKDKGHLLETRQSPLQEKNSTSTPWNVRKTSYSYNSTETATKRPIGSPQANEIYSPPTAKRRGNAEIFDMVRPTNDQRTTQFTSHTGEHHSKSENVSYAKKMAQGYLRSMGMGEWTPKISSAPEHKPVAKSESRDSATSKWKNIDDDQDFDF